MKYILALDQGTTSSRALLFDESGTQVSIAQQEFKQIYPREGWVEHDAEEVARTQLAVAEQSVRAAGIAVADIAAIGIANQRETIVLWDRVSGKPVSNAIVWQDRRTSSLCDKMRAAGLEHEIVEKTGLMLDPYFSATKLSWLLDNTPGARKAACEGRLLAGTIDAWLVYQLTGGKLHITDASNASRTQLMNLYTGDWDDALLEHFHIPREVLPAIHSSSGVVCEATDFLAGVPIAGIAGDQQAALFGQTAFRRGAVKNTYGTGCFTLMNTGEEAVRSKNRLLTTIAWRLNKKTEYALEGSVFIGGAVVSWLRDGLGIIKTSAEVESLAASVKDSGGVFLVPAFAGLGAPHWDPHARGTITGITSGTTAANLARAALDSIALQSVDLIDAMRADAGGDLPALRVDGGASANDLLMQRQADLLQAPVLRSAQTEATALGAAYLAGLAVGVWSDRDHISSQWRLDRQFDPHISAEEAQEIRTRWRRAVDRSLRWSMEKEAETR